jgi:hypothetical protein
VVLGGDLRQTLLVIQGGSRSEVINSAIVNSSLWSYVTVLHLTTNMRLSTRGLIEEARKELADFSKWMLAVGEGEINTIAKQDETKPSWIEIPDEFLLKTSNDKIECMINVVYSDLKTDICGH